MKTRFLSILTGVSAVSILAGSCRKDFHEDCNCRPDQLVASVSVYAKGLNNPRGLRFGPDEMLYVAEGGTGGTDSSKGCDQVIPPVGPYTGSPTNSRIVKIGKNGQIMKVADDLPSSQTAPALGTLISGVGDISFIGSTLYGVLAGAGCSHGVQHIPNGIVKVLPGKKWDLIANLSYFQQHNPVANPNIADFEPDGTWYSMITINDELYALEPNHGEIDKIDANGHITRVVDISKTQGHIVPTVMTYHEGAIYFGNLGTFPLGGKSNIYRLSSNGQITTVATGFSAITGIAFDKLGGLYVLENTTGNPFPTPGTGDVIRIDPSGARLNILSGLSLPTYMIIGPDDKLYISNWGFGPPAIGGGEIWQVGITCAKNNIPKS